MGTVPALYVAALVVGNAFIIACLAATWLVTHRAAVVRRWQHMRGQITQALAAHGTEPAAAALALPWNASQPSLGQPANGHAAEDQHVVSVGAVQLNAEPLEIAWRNMACTYENNKGEAVAALQSVYGKALPYEVLAILGPSGSGKTTLMDILALRHISGAVTGSITTNGRPVSLKFIQKRAYVPQEHHFAPIITAWEVVYFYASLCGSSNTATAGDARARAFAALEIMGLSAQANTLVGGTYSTGLSFRGLSGGEKKRLNIACHIVGNPSALFLDEPTSGLDASAALKVMRYMRVLALSGRTVILTIHQPRAAIWEHIDKVMVLARGNMLYYGQPDGAVPWLTQTLQCTYEANLHGIWSDWVMDLISPVAAASEDEGEAAAGAHDDTMAAVGAAAADRHSQHGVRCDALRVPGNLEAAAATFLKRYFEHEKQGQQQGHSGEVTAELLNGNYPPQQQQQQQQELEQQQQNGVAAGETAACNSQDRASQAPSTASISLNGIKAWELAPSGSSSIDAAVPAITAIRQNQRHGCAAGVRGWLSQLRVLLWREMIIVTRNPADAAGRMAAATYVGLVIGLVFVDADHVKPYSALPRIGCMFMSMVTIALLPFVSMSIFVTNRNAFLFDASEELYSTTAYYTAQTLVNSATSGLNALVFTACVYGLAGLRTTPVASVFWVLLMLVLLHLIFVQALIWFAMLATSQDVAFAFAIAFTTFNATLGNYVLLWQNMKLVIFQWLRYLSAMYYSTGALVQIEFKDNTAGCSQKGIIIGLTGPTDCQGIGNQVVDAFTNYPLGWTAAILCLYLTVTHMATIATTLWRVRKQRSHHHVSRQNSWMQVLGHRPQQEV